MTARSTASIRLLDAIHAARDRKASDVHLGAGMPPVLRVDGVLERTPEPPLTCCDVDEIAALVMTEHEMTRLAADGDVTTAWTEPDVGTTRVHAYRAQRGLAIAIRLFDRKIPSLESLALPDAVGSLAYSERGMVILAGPTGSGKSTTMAALVDRINAERPRRIVTIEDPIEYRHESRSSVVTQREIGRDTPSLRAALHGALRADPDVIVVGEMRDAESMAAALTAAETGHLVLTTLHTGDAAQTVERIVDASSGELQSQIRTQLAQVLVAVACQHLVRRAGGTGRRAAVELLVGTDAVRNLIRESKGHQLKNAMATGRRFGMQTLEQHIAELLRDREIDAADARRFVLGDRC